MGNIMESLGSSSSLLEDGLRSDNQKLKYEGHCDAHGSKNELRCMDCEEWLCATCGMLPHERCRTLAAAEAFEELKELVSLKVAKELGEWTLSTENIKGSWEVLDAKRKELIEELATNKNRLEELECSRLRESKFCEDLDQLQTLVRASQSFAEFFEAKRSVEQLLEMREKNFVERLNLTPLSIESLERWCKDDAIYAVDTQGHAPLYGKVALKEGDVWVSSFKPETPTPTCRLISFKKLLLKVSGSTELPKTAFLKLTPILPDTDANDGDEVEGSYIVGDSLEVTIETEPLFLRSRNFIYLCSALKGPTYKGLTMKAHYSHLSIVNSDPPVVEEITVDTMKTPVKEAGIYGMREKDSRFGIQLRDVSRFYLPRFGVVTSGLQDLKDSRGWDCAVTECGLVLRPLPSPI